MADVVVWLMSHLIPAKNLLSIKKQNKSQKPHFVSASQCLSVCKGGFNQILSRSLLFFFTASVCNLGGLGGCIFTNIFSLMQL